MTTGQTFKQGTTWRWTYDDSHFVVIIAAIYLIWRSSNGGQTPTFTSKNNVQSMTDSELEAELKSNGS